LAAIAIEALPPSTLPAQVAVTFLTKAAGAAVVGGTAGAVVGGAWVAAAWVAAAWTAVPGLGGGGFSGWETIVSATNRTAPTPSPASSVSSGAVRFISNSFVSRRANRLAGPGSAS
jgi:hypothetical protein